MLPLLPRLASKVERITLPVVVDQFWAFAALCLAEKMMTRKMTDMMISEKQIEPTAIRDSVLMFCMFNSVNDKTFSLYKILEHVSIRLWS